ncbi:MAG: hypothetical protein AAF654_00440 [Myxococcota bacterium]
MPRNASFTEKLRYRIDNYLARGSGALFLALVLAFLGSLGLIALFRLALNVLVPEAGPDFGLQLWFIFLQLTDPGNMAQDNATPTIFKVTAILAGLTGVVIFSALIAFLTTALDQAISNLKQGRTGVLESDHTLIIGWGPRVVEILRELVEANESESNPTVVVLADREKEEIDDYLRLYFTDRRNTRLVTRSGQTSSLASLEHVAAADAKSAIVLAFCEENASAEDKAASDAKVIKTVLALGAVGEHEFPIVAEVFNERNRSIVESVAPGRVTVIDTQSILAKVMVQTSRTSGLSTVYAELLSFRGCEMYFWAADDWRGVEFGQAQFHFPDGVPMGIRTADDELIVRPALDRRLGPGDEILIVANDDSTIDFKPKPVVEPVDLELPSVRLEQRQENKLIIGWTPKAPTIIQEYADYVLDGSRVNVMLAEPSKDMRRTLRTLNEQLTTVTVGLYDREPLDEMQLDSVKPLLYDDVTVLPRDPPPDADPETVDAETLMVLLHLRKLQDRSRSRGERPRTKLITEVLDSENQELVAQAGVNDFIISNQMISMIFAQLSEEPAMKRVYDDLFAEDGSEIYVKPAHLYFSAFPVRCRFADLMSLAQRRDGEVCIGLKDASLEHDSGKNYGITLIPPKDTEVTIRRGDALVVVAEDDR